jgi:alkanesulfonate monooxygenase SsuD/methylene tetrahydromethanopterin reductase-like flavin-dependent oxidoreductase (luciferase family)
MDWHVWIAAASSLFGAILTAAVAIKIFLAGKAERQRDMDRQALIDEVRGYRKEHQECQKTQRLCQLSLATDFRTKAEADKDWSKQGSVNDELFTRTNDLNAKVCKLEVQVGAK